MAIKAKPTITNEDSLIKNIQDITGLYTNVNNEQHLDSKRHFSDHDENHEAKMVAGERFKTNFVVLSLNPIQTDFMIENSGLVASAGLG